MSCLAENQRTRRGTPYRQEVLRRKALSLAAIAAFSMGALVTQGALGASSPPPSLKQKLLQDAQRFLRDSNTASACTTIPCQEKWLAIAGNDALRVGADEAKLASYVPAGGCKTEVLAIASGTKQVGSLEIRFAKDLRHPVLSQIQAFSRRILAAEQKLARAESSNQCSSLALPL